MSALFEPLPGRLISAGKIRMFAATAGEGPPLVFIHGLGWSHALWRRQLERLSGAYRVIAADTRGHGQSDKPPGPYAIADFAQDWLALLDALDVRRCCVVGFSQGGMVAQAIAERDPGRVAALVLAGTACRSKPEMRAIMEQRLAAAAAEGPRAAAGAAAASIFSPAFMARNPDFIAAFVEWRQGHDQAALAAATRALYDFDFRDALAALRCPVRVISGAEDRLAPPQAGEEIARLAPGARFSVIEGAGHMIQIEQPEAFDRALDVFLSEHFPRRPQ
jgi:3-oxoadipate enol-lactonase